MASEPPNLPARRSSRYKDVCPPPLFQTSLLFLFSSSSNCPVRPPSCLRPRWAPPAPAHARPPQREYEAASEKKATMPPPGLVRSTIAPAVPPRPSNRGPTPESDADTGPGPSRSPTTRSRDGLKCSFSGPLHPISWPNRSHDPTYRGR